MVLSKYRKNLWEGDLEVLTDIFADVLPITMSGVVQAEVLVYDGEDPSHIAFYRAGGLIQDVSLLMSRFENTGVTLIPGDNGSFD